MNEQVVTEVGHCHGANAPIGERVLGTLKVCAVLSKPRVLLMVVIVTILGFILAGGNIISQFWLFIATILGTALTGIGSTTLNQFLEIESDALMHRTKHRPLPTKKISPESALFFGMITILLGVGLLVTEVNLLTGFLALLTAFLYVLVYTPLKKVTWLNTLIGAIPGALPPMGGWTAVTGGLEPGAWILFLILFVWQQPHFFAIAWMYRDDYARGGYKMLPVLEPSGTSTFSQIVWFSHLLIAVSILPVWYGLVGVPYLIGAITAGIYFLASGIVLSHSRSNQDAKKVLKASLAYLPAIFLSVLIDLQF